MLCQQCNADMEPIFSYKFPDEPYRVYLSICTQCLSYLQEYMEQGGEINVSMWGRF